jgi:ABC-type lipoprotein release transport system permease subunit
MSLTVTRRRNEIGIRVAFGSSRGRLLASIFSRAALQLGVGGVIGAVLAVVLLRVNPDTASESTLPVLVVTALMLMAGLIATAWPAWRGMRIQPMEALRAEE